MRDLAYRIPYLPYLGYFTYRTVPYLTCTQGGFGKPKTHFNLYAHQQPSGVGVEWSHPLVGATLGVYKQGRLYTTTTTTTTTTT
jgi:hypothetical protein